ncbi:unnamed protein product [Closterium sp. Naga37s-1]|nr:unnamed protein product [Closterium sp. Naga37s-1]
MMPARNDACTLYKLSAFPPPSLVISKSPACSTSPHVSAALPLRAASFPHPSLAMLPPSPVASPSHGSVLYIRFWRLQPLVAAAAGEREGAGREGVQAADAAHAAGRAERQRATRTCPTASQRPSRPPFPALFRLLMHACPPSFPRLPLYAFPPPPQLRAYRQQLLPCLPSLNFPCTPAPFLPSPDPVRFPFPLSYVHIDNSFSAALTAAQVQRMRRHPSVASVTPSRTVNCRAVTAAADGHNRPLSSALFPTWLPPSTPHPPPLQGYSSTLPAWWAGTTSDFACNNKIIGGGIFHAGFESKYGGQGPGNDELVSPRDSDGHGTWSAGAAAGNNGVEVPGGGTISGVAIKARLAIYKVYWDLGGPGESITTDADVFAAVDQAVVDGVDMLMLSLDNTHRNTTWDQFDKWNWAYFDDVPSSALLRWAGVIVSFAVGHYLYGPAPAIDNFAPYYISVGASTVLQSLTSSSTTAAATALKSRANTTGLAPSTQQGTRLPATISPASTFLPMVPKWSSKGPLAAPGCSVCRPKKARPSNTILKPDIIAPGANILAAAPGTTVGETGSF